ncbi:MAG TPA: type 1 glutamine amidotransferase domain-containing protein [Caulobacteraceae bacterium]|jgi:putative intracellular protease/amidase|nr:type 1 glutamine amidotransferase domain-containing protein [Caulobacteraceae bacterium]
MKALIVVTSADHLDEAHPTGVSLEEYAVLFTALCEAGIDPEVASPQGGAAPIDPRTAPDEAAKARWRRALDTLADTRPLGGVRGDDCQALIFPGGHGLLIDLAADGRVADLATAFAASGRVIAALCHGPAALLGAKGRDGAPLVAGRKLTAFTNGEETLGGLQTVVPFLLETRLREAGAQFEHALLPGGSHVTCDGDLLTGQNPASGDALARVLLKELGQRQRVAMQA